MRILLTGVSCVGKTTIGRLLADRLGLPFFDLDEAVENHFGASIERLQARFLTGYGYRKEASVVLKHILTDNLDCVIALAPSGLRDAYMRVIRKARCVTVVLEDTPDSILQRIVFYDIDSRLIDKTLSETDKALYRKEIAGDMAFFRKSYERADLQVHIGGLGAPESAERIAERLARVPRLMR
jgi:shikimate kinase